MFSCHEKEGICFWCWESSPKTSAAYLKKRYGQTDRIMDGQTELWSSFATNNDKIICTRNEVSLDQPVFSSKKSLIMIGLSAFCHNPLPLKYIQTFSKIA